RDAAGHQAAREALASLARSGRRWAVPWPCVHEFLAIVTHPRIYRPPTESSLGMTTMAALQRLPQVMFLAETGDHLDILGRLPGSPPSASATVWTCSGPLTATSAISRSCARTIRWLRDDPAAWKIGGVIAPADVLTSVLRRSGAGGCWRGSRVRRGAGRHGSRGCAQQRRCRQPAGRGRSRRPPTPPGGSPHRGLLWPGPAGCRRTDDPGA